MKYIGYYPLDKKGSNYLQGSLAAMNKMNNIFHVLEELGYEPLLVNPSVPMKRKKLQKNFTVPQELNMVQPLYFRHSAILSRINIIMSFLWITIFLLFRVRKNEKIVLYHSPKLTAIAMIIKKIKKYHIILELNELYSLVDNTNLDYEKEVRDVKKADGYILATKGIANILNISADRYIVHHGSYETFRSDESFPDEKVHLVYAGIINDYKGVNHIFKLAEKLTSKQIIHILGFGKDDAVKKLHDKVYYHNNLFPCKVLFHGSKIGEEFKTFLSKCNIGLSLQAKDTSFGFTSFPSKISTYLGAGLQVYSEELSVFRDSILEDLINTYSTLSHLASEILQYESNNKHIIKKIKRINEEFKCSLSRFLERKL